MAPVKKTLARERERAKEVFVRLASAYPDMRCTLDYETPLDLLVATILAAQCTDERVNIVSKRLFQKYRTCEDYLKVPVEELEQDVQSCGFYRQKTKSIRETCRALIERFDGQVPNTMEALLSLRGVGRKTANVILGTCFGHQGIIVDTHCRRLSNRLGFSRHTDPEKIERDLAQVWPPDHWTDMSHCMVFHGRAICSAARPKCSQCCIRDLCPFPDTPQGAKSAR